MEYEITNPRWVRPNMIDVDWDHPTLGPITYSAVDKSGETEMQAIWDAVRRGAFGPIADQTPKA